MTTGFLYSPLFLDHDTGPTHPETSRRLVATSDYLRSKTWFNKLKKYAAKPAEREWLEKVHTSRHIDRVAFECSRGLSCIDTPDVAICPESFNVAVNAVGGVLALADGIILGDIDNAFALIRPPGHHAESDFPMGFCLFNSIAISARYLQQKHGVEKILILDWDVHHGNGTQRSFENDPSILYISLHQFPYYPGTGDYNETGVDAGEGSVLNCPMEAGAGDQEYEQAFLKQILPKIDEFKPDMVLLSAGFDAHASDPLAAINLSTEFFGWMSQRMMEVADKYAEGRLLSMLEGGYNLETLPFCVETHLVELMGQELSKQEAI
ncbi:histone deacetylase [Pseudomonadota bacterium]